MKLKVCGMTYQDNITQVAALQPDYLGFIFYEKSPRNFKLETLEKIPNSIKKTGVFVNSALDFIVEKVNHYKFKAIQLHGEESPEFCATLRKTLNNKSSNYKDIEIIKVFSIKDAFDFKILEPYEGLVDYFLFDTKGKNPGGNGYTFQWSILNKYSSKTPFFLSGGIGLNETELLKMFQNSKASKYCYAIDVNSKFEVEPGIKNIEALKAFKHNFNLKS